MVCYSIELGGEERVTDYMKHDTKWKMGELTLKSVAINFFILSLMVWQGFCFGVPP